MAYHATLEIEGERFDVVWCKYSIRRSVDLKGRPSSNLYGGQLTIQIESSDNNEIVKLMNSQFKSTAGTITFTKDEEEEMKEWKWNNGYIVDFEEGMENTDGTPMSLTFIVSAQSLTVRGTTLEQSWPELK